MAITFMFCLTRACLIATISKRVMKFTVNEFLITVVGLALLRLLLMERSIYPAKTATSLSSRPGRSLKCLATNSIGEPLMATPAISGGKMFVRSQQHLFAIGR